MRTHAMKPLPMIITLRSHWESGLFSDGFWPCGGSLKSPARPRWQFFRWCCRLYNTRLFPLCGHVAVPYVVMVVVFVDSVFCDPGPSRDPPSQQALSVDAGSLRGSKLCGHAGRPDGVTAVAIALELPAITRRATLRPPVYRKPRNGRKGFASGVDDDSQSQLCVGARFEGPLHKVRSPVYGFRAGYGSL